MSIQEYFVSLFKGMYSLVRGMQVTGRELVTKKVTEQYPENRSTLQIPERFRATLQFIYDDDGRHKCIGCRSCERACPNGTIHIDTRMVDLPNGKKKMKLDKYIYDLGSCTFCSLCVQSCPTAAIEFSNDFEQAVFRREALVKQLNYLPEKDDEPAPAKPAAAPAKPAVTPKAAEKPAEAANEVTKAAEKPAEAANEVTKAAEKPAEAANEVTKAAEKPAEAANEVTKVAEKPAEAANEVTKVAEKPADATKTDEISQENKENQE